jgi:hypothetical protein
MEKWPMFSRRSFLALTAALLVAPAVQAQVAVPPGTKLIIVRHADRTGENLNDRGKARAKALVGALAGMPIDAIYSPGFQRNLDTAAPLAAARGLAVTRIPADNPAARLMAEGAGKTIVWVGNKGNLQSIWDDLGAPGPAPLEYGDLFIVESGGNGPKVTRRRFEP